MKPSALVCGVLTLAVSEWICARYWFHYKAKMSQGIKRNYRLCNLFALTALLLPGRGSWFTFSQAADRGSPSPKPWIVVHLLPGRGSPRQAFNCGENTASRSSFFL